MHVFEIRPKQWLEAFSEYCATCDSAWPERIEGATLEEVQTLQALSGIVLPQEYRVFLQNMGRNDGGLLGVRRLEGSIHDVVGYYEDERQFEPDVIRRDHVVIAYGVDIEEVVLRCDRDAAMCEVWSASGGEYGQYLARDFVSFLFQRAFIWGEPLRLRRASARLGGDYRQKEKGSSGKGVQTSMRKHGWKSVGDVYEALQEGLQKAGLKMAWWNDARTLCGYDDMCSLVLTFHQLEASSLFTVTTQMWSLSHERTSEIDQVLSQSLTALQTV